MAAVAVVSVAPRCPGKERARLPANPRAGDPSCGSLSLLRQHLRSARSTLTKVLIRFRRSAAILRSRICRSSTRLCVCVSAALTGSNTSAFPRSACAGDSVVSVSVCVPLDESDFSKSPPGPKIFSEAAMDVVSRGGADELGGEGEARRRPLANARTASEGLRNIHSHL